jgi:signal transduction histidine kinase
MNSQARVSSEVSVERPSLERLQAARETFELIQHRLSQPLTSVRCCLELLGKDGQKDPHYVKWARRENERTAELLRDVGVALRCSEAQAKGETVAISEEIARCVEEIEPIAVGLDVSIVVSCVEDVRVLGPQSLLREVLIGILDEAVQQASKHQRHRVELTVERRNLGVSPGVTLKVSYGDSGRSQESSVLRLAERTAEALGGHFNRIDGEFALDLLEKRPQVDMLLFGGQR